MKIAVITDDEKTISQHFGRAPYYMVFTIEDGHIIRPVSVRLSVRFFMMLVGELFVTQFITPLARCDLSVIYREDHVK